MDHFVKTIAQVQTYWEISEKWSKNCKKHHQQHHKNWKCPQNIQKIHYHFQTITLQTKQASLTNEVIKARSSLLDTGCCALPLLMLSAPSDFSQARSSAARVFEVQDELLAVWKIPAPEKGPHCCYAEILMHSSLGLTKNQMDVAKNKN